MAEYINREDVLNKVLHTDSIYGAYMSIAKLKPADVVERKHGKWIMNDECSTVCSLCGNTVAFVSHPDRLWDFGNYCPNCGAKMDKDGDGDV